MPSDQQTASSSVDVEALRLKYKASCPLTHPDWYTCAWCDVLTLLAALERAQQEIVELRACLAELSDPDNWDHVNETTWHWRGYPPFERGQFVLSRRSGQAQRGQGQ